MEAKFKLKVGEICTHLLFFSLNETHRRFGALFSLPTSFPNCRGQTPNSSDKLTCELFGKEALLDNMHINIHFYTLPIKNKIQTTQKIKQSFLK